MARYTATLDLPAWIRGDTGSKAMPALVDTLQQLDLEMVHSTALHIVAVSPDNHHWPVGFRVLLGLRSSTSTAHAPTATVELCIEVLSRESMVTGAPATKALLGQLVDRITSSLACVDVPLRPVVLHS